MAIKIFVNLPVKDLSRSIQFFTHLGFGFNQQFTDEKGTCMIVGEDIYVMLFLERFFRMFTKKRVLDAMDGTEVILALSAESRDDVDDMVKRATQAGGSAPGVKQDDGFLYGWGFQDPDGHMWEVIYLGEGRGEVSSGAVGGGDVPGVRAL